MHATSSTCSSHETTMCEVSSNGLFVLVTLRFRLGRVTEESLAHCTARKKTERIYESQKI